MELSTNAKKSINDVRKIYEDRNCLADVDFLCSIFDIMEQEDGFHEVLSYEIMSGDKRIAYEQRGRVFIDLDKARKETLYSYKCAKKCNDVESEIACRNMFMLVIVFHELSHISQDYGFSNFTALNNLFEAFEDAYDKYRYFIYYGLFKRRYDFCERHANMHSFRLLSDIYKNDSLNEILGDNYFAMVKGNIKRKYVDYAIKHLGMTYGYFETLPLIQKMDACITLSFEEEAFVRGIISDYELGNIDFSESIKQLKRSRY